MDIGSCESADMGVNIIENKENFLIYYPEHQNDCIFYLYFQKKLKRNLS